MFGKSLKSLKSHDYDSHKLTEFSGVYCAAVVITLLNLPLELPPQSPAWSCEGDTFLKNLPEWIARCRSNSFTIPNLY